MAAREQGPWQLRQAELLRAHHALPGLRQIDKRGGCSLVRRSLQGLLLRQREPLVGSSLFSRWDALSGAAGGQVRAVVGRLPSRALAWRTSGCAAACSATSLREAHDLRR